ncbi:MAG: glycosyltransferase [Firmicutes bacterium]|nr:glycosyltransferase [Bacillota bacterium]
MISFLFSTLLALFWIVQGLVHVPSLSRVRPLPFLGDQLDLPKQALSRAGDAAAVTVILAARDEEAAIAATLEALAAQTWPHLKIIALNDRSRDRTGLRMREAAAQSARIQVIDIDVLPEGWLGKNHALTVGAREAEADWLLFTDADVAFSADAVARMVGYAEREGLDHLVVSPELIADSFWLRSLIAFFLFNFILAFRPQKAINPRSRAFMGLGACNFVRRTAYEAIGTHAAIRLRPDEDIRLGQRLKQAGYRQQFVPARAFARVRWYDSVAAMANGLEKNTLALFRYSPTWLMLSMIPFLLIYVVPFVNVLYMRGFSEGMALLALAAMAAVYGATQRFTAYTPALFLVLPVSATLFAAILVRAAWLTARQGGIYWRGTFHSLQELRKMR